MSSLTYLAVIICVVYSVQADTEVTCQADSPMEIDCVDMVIHIIDANYGRTDDASTCPHNAVSDQDCHADDSMTPVQILCEGENTCSIPVTNGFFGGPDPCFGTYKYLELDFECVEPPEPVPGLVITCQADSPMELACSDDMVIHITSANYGRTDDASTCPHNAVSDQDCHAVDSMTPVQVQCEGQNTCSIPVNNEFFGGPDPCHGTYKYLELQYECAIPVEPVPDLMEIGCFNGNSENDPIPSLECQDHRLDDSYQDRDDPVEKCAQVAVAQGWTTFSLLDGGACHSADDACQNHDNYGETTGCGATGTSSKHAVYEIIKSDLVCQDETLHLECDCGFIHVVYANYGRTDGVTCGGPVLTISCTADNSYSHVSGLCDRKTSCDIDTGKSVFGDPCHGTFKYLEVKYFCNVIPGELEQPTTVITCQADGPMELDCFDMAIHIIDADYGRTDDESTCPHNAVSDQDCHAADSMTPVQVLCEGQNTCSIPVNNAFFGGPDPCFGTYKYLEVEYNCM